MFFCLAFYGYENSGKQGKNGKKMLFWSEAKMRVSPLPFFSESWVINVTKFFLFPTEQRPELKARTECYQIWFLA